MASMEVSGNLEKALSVPVEQKTAFDKLERVCYTGGVQELETWADFAVIVHYTPPKALTLVPEQNQVRQACGGVSFGGVTMEEEDRYYNKVADLFPLLDGPEYEELKADIAKNGLLEAIWLHPDGSIIDGRNRHRACTETGTQPRFRTWSGQGSLVAFVVSMNLHRRHLTYDQRVGIALKLEPAFAEEAKERQREHGNTAPGRQKTLLPKSVKVKDAAKEAATQANVGKTAVVDMKAIEKEQPDLADRLVAGKTTVRKERKKRNRKKRVERVLEITEENTELDTSKRYSVIYADPPWRYEHSKTDNRKVENHYPTMALADIQSLPVSELATPDAVLFLWATSPKLAEAMTVIEKWGFTYRTCMVWVKDRIGMGYYARQRHELLLIAVRGSLPVPESANRHDSVVESPRLKHSKKPDVFYEIIEAMYPEYGKIELFSRNRREGWARWGNQTL